MAEGRIPPATGPGDADMGLDEAELPLGQPAGAPPGGPGSRNLMDLDSIRKKIDALDSELVLLVNKRLALAAEIGKIKRGTGEEIYVPEREDAVLRKVCDQNRGPVRDEALRAIYREIMSAAIALEKPLLVAYLGPEASNTHSAAKKKFGASVDYHAMATIEDIFTAVEKGEADNAVIPIENSTEGSVREALDSFVESDLKIVGQIYLEITHALIAQSTTLEKIERVYSKDQALAQCRHWLQRHLPHAQPAGGLEHDARGADRQGGPGGGRCRERVRRGSPRRAGPRAQHPGQGRQHDPLLRPRTQAGGPRGRRQGHDELPHLARGRGCVALRLAPEDADAVRRARD